MLPSYWHASVVSFWLTYVSLFFCSPFLAWGAKRLTINWSSDWTEFFDSSGNPLPQGDPSINQDGAAVQLGYFSQATTDDLFAGEWVPLTWSTTVGDTLDRYEEGYGDGFFSFNVHFEENSSQFVQVYGDDDLGSYTTESSTL